MERVLEYCYMVEKKLDMDIQYWYLNLPWFEEPGMQVRVETEVEEEKICRRDEI